MNKYLLNTILLTFTLFLFLGCSIKIDSSSVNRSILPNQLGDVTTFLNSKTYNTYDDAQKKITSYYFKIKDGELQAYHEITYIPYDTTNQLYSPFSEVGFFIRKFQNEKIKTLEDALNMEVAKHNFTLLYIDKKEYIIGNDFAIDIKYGIREFEERDMRFDIMKRILVF